MVLPISLIANLPSCGKSEYFSRTRGFIGLNLTIAISPAFMNWGFFSVICPVLGSTFPSISTTLHATDAVWACITGV